jgi:hypothetical protein
MALLLPDALLRGVLRCDPTDPEDGLITNLTMLRGDLQPTGIDVEVMGFACNILDRAKQVPSLQVAIDHFTDLQTQGLPAGPAALQRLVPLQLSRAPWIDPPSFRLALDKHREDVLQDTTVALLTESIQIMQHGVNVRRNVNGQWVDVPVKGPSAAVEHLQAGVSSLGYRLRTQQSQGTLSRDTAAIRADYANAKANPQAQYGVLSGLNAIDTRHRGLRNGNLALVLGFAGHMKTTFCMAVMHTNHPKFFDAYPNVPPVSFEALNMGSLTPEQEQVFHEAMLDIETHAGSAYGLVHYKEPEKEMTVETIFRWAEQLYRSEGALDLLVIDYLGLVDPSPSKKGGSRSGLAEYANLNVAIRETKLNALAFAGGRGIPVLSPFQANREGLKEAEKNGGRYTLRALAGANEAERSADLVYYTYLDDTLREANEISVGNIKARNVKLITDQFRFYADGATRLVDDASPAISLDAQGQP